VFPLFVLNSRVGKKGPKPGAVEHRSWLSRGRERRNRGLAKDAEKAATIAAQKKTKLSETAASTLETLAAEDTPRNPAGKEAVRPTGERRWEKKKRVPR